MTTYRRPLPEFCISFNSDEGKKIFKEALNEGEDLFNDIKINRSSLTDHISLLFRVHELLFSTGCSVSYSGGACILWPLNSGHGSQYSWGRSRESLEGALEMVSEIRHHKNSTHFHIITLHRWLGEYECVAVI